MSQTLILIRGLPGSGKSTLAEALANTKNTFHIEADMYFLDYDGVYKFDPTKLKDAHAWCLQTCIYHLFKGSSMIVSNTFTQLWEMKPYIDAAESRGIPVQVITCQANFRNIHNVPAEKIAQMAARWENF